MAESRFVVRGREHHRRGELQQAHALYTAALAENPLESEAHHLLGVIAQQRGDFAGCIGRIETALAIRKSAPAYSNMGHALWRLGRHGEAEAACRAALALDPRSIDARQNLGNALHAQGRLEEAALVFEEALSHAPGHRQLGVNLGIVRFELGAYPQSLILFDAVLAQAPDDASAHFNRGNVLFRMGEADQAVAAFRRALEIQPRLAPAAHNLGAALRALGRREEALAAYRTAVALDPDRADSHVLLGALLVDLGQHAEAIPICRRALALQPDNTDAQLALGVALVAAKKSYEAVGLLRAVVAAQPDLFKPLPHLADALRDLGDLAGVADVYRYAALIDAQPAQSLSRLGGVLKELGQFQAAIEACIRAIRADPAFADPYINLGAAKIEQGRLAEAITALETAIRLDPESGVAHSNLGVALFRQGRLEPAIAAFETGLGYHDAPDARWSYSHALLKVGRFQEGWASFEQRLHIPGPVKTAQDYPEPRWSGQPFEGQTLLLHAEQGIGDAIQCLRYVPLAAERGGRVIVQVREPLADLARRMPGVAEVFTGGRPQGFDWHCPMFSLPGVFEANEQTIPRAPYLKADPALEAAWALRLGTEAGRPHRVGVVWQGNPGASVERGRSIPLSAFAPLAAIPGVELVCLQKEHGIDQLEQLAPDMPVRRLGDDYEIGAFDDTAAVIMNLDLVVCCDTSVAHLAGALGRPVWLAVNAVSDWRWMEARSDSPWYPSMRIFRQPRVGDWGSVMEAIAQALAARLAA